MPTSPSTENCPSPCGRSSPTSLPIRCNLRAIAPIPATSEAATERTAHPTAASAGRARRRRTNAFLFRTPTPSHAIVGALCF
ncbi:hypothetical protein pdul_cds_599 [Pandoravirus dulcis]|uniref:Uncharacterized protein n=1 Tax=Pandoravirus dulcis TaxID=1349409 RepID=S4VR18_9VIRU|nr:hypothetical protein pdul_cds_599 [Pandoravirus dulcis]AGO82722.1 hypothetical protein pdul_cds_599 [Pandoravirus dulcis]